MLTSDMFKDFFPTILTFVIPTLIIGIFFSIIKAVLGSSKNNKHNYKYQKQKLLTNNELNFYKLLYPIVAKKGFILFAKTRLADLIEPKKGISNWQESFNKIKSKHVDFVLCENTAINPILVIELDDKTHDRSDRQDRDNFVDQALESAGIPILHTRTADKLEENITAKLSQKITSRK